MEDDGGSSPGVSTPHVPDHGTCASPTCTADSGADDPTAEKDPPPLPPRLMDDVASTLPLSGSADQSTPPQVTTDGGGDPTYALVLTTTPHAVSQPAATEKVSYEDIQKYQNEQVGFSHICGWLCNCHAVSCLSFFFSIYGHRASTMPYHN